MFKDSYSKSVEKVESLNAKLTQKICLSLKNGFLNHSMTRITFSFFLSLFLAFLSFFLSLLVLSLVFSLVLKLETRKTNLQDRQSGFRSKRKNEREK